MASIHLKARNNMKTAVEGLKYVQRGVDEVKEISLWEASIQIHQLSGVYDLLELVNTAVCKSNIRK